MINIIKPGKDKKEITVNIYKLTCSNCDCTFEFNIDDADSYSAERSPVSSMGNYYTTFTGKYSGEIHCPYCGTKLYFTDSAFDRTETRTVEVKKVDSKKKTLEEAIDDSLDRNTVKQKSISLEDLLKELPTIPAKDLKITYVNNPNELDCNLCPNKPDPNKIIIGDTPCTWCKKNVPTC